MDGHAPALVVRLHHAAGRHLRQLGELRPRLDARGAVVVAGDHDRRHVELADTTEEPEDEPLGLGRRRRDIEDVPGHQHEIDPLALHSHGEIVEDGLEFLQARLPFPRLASVPV